MDWRVGTSGFSYDEWVGPFYPEAMPGAQRLAYYAERLPAVEINNTFYRMPKAAVLEGWAGRVPPGFRFALKAPRRITHAAKDADPSEAVAHLFGVAAALGDRLGPILFQLPPYARMDLDRLRVLLARVPSGRRVAFEFRHPSWLDDAVFAVLRESGAALCAADFDESEKRVPIVATAAFGYLRLRAADYPIEQLRAWADTIGAQPWRETFVFFKHEDEGAAPVLARQLLAIVNGLAPEDVVRGPKRAEKPAKRPARAPAKTRPARRGEG